MQIDHLYDLLEVARCGSINKASSNLHMQQQNLSRLIRKFEDEIGVTLFNRSSKGLTLTSQGEQVIERIGQMIKLYNEILALGDKETALPAGTLKYLTTADIWATTIYQLIDGFTKLHPQIVVAIEEISAEYIPEQLRQEQWAVAKMLLIDNGLRVNQQVSADQRLYNTYAMQPVVYAHKDSAFTRRYKSVSLGSLLHQRQPIAVYRPYDKGKTVAECIFDGIGEPNIRYFCSNAQGFYNILRSGECVTVGCMGPFNNPAREDIAIIPIRDQVIITAGLLVNQKDCTKPLVQAFLKFAEQFIKQYL